jgi:DNA-binding beta-propeller fold protein YncE
MNLFIQIILACTFVFASGEKTTKKPRKLSVAFRFEIAFAGKGGGLGKLHNPSGIALDPVGTVYVADTGNNRVQKFDRDGEYLVEAGDFGWDPGQFNKPTGAAIGRSGLEIYVADSQNNRIQVLSPHLALLAVVGGKDAEGPVPLGNLSGIAVSAEGEIYVCDEDADQVVQISTFSRTDRSFGGYGYGAGNIQRPLGLAISNKGDVYVCDSHNSRIAVFDRFGNFKRPLGEDVLSSPSGVAVGPEGTLFVADTGHHRVTVLDQKTGEVVGSIGGPRAGSKAGTFDSPRDVILGKDDVMYVLDTGNHRVQKFRVMVLRR